MKLTIIGSGAAALLLCAMQPARAQIITQHSFTNTPDGAIPTRLTQTGGLLFGITSSGGTNGNGTVFLFDPSDSEYSTIYNFSNSVINDTSPNNPLASGSEIYGTAQVDGTNGLGVVFELSTNGEGFTLLHTFQGPPDGQYPRSGLVLVGGCLYGATDAGGAAPGPNDSGTIFKINTDGQGYAIMHSFSNSPDGAEPQSELVSDGVFLYGTTFYGGSNGNGAIFAIQTNGDGYTLLRSFTNAPDPINPLGGLVLSDGVLYGAGSSGGASNNGAIFAINTDGTDFRILHSFSSSVENTDGGVPESTLALSGSLLYGTAASGGSGGGGTLFQINTDGSGFQVLYSFTNNPSINGFHPTEGVILADNALWGTTSFGGAGGYGTLYDLAALPFPHITRQPQSAVVTNGDPVAFTSAATGAGDLSVQWFFQTNILVDGATNTSLTFTNATANLAGFYSMRATDTFGSTTSSYALLTVSNDLNLLSFTIDPVNQSASFALANAANSTNLLWASTNLTSPASWTVIATNIMATNGLWFYTDPASTQTDPVRFYRFSSP